MYPYDIARSMDEKFHYQFRNRMVDVYVDSTIHSAHISIGNKEPCIEFLIKVNEPGVELISLNTTSPHGCIKRGTQERQGLGTFMLKLAIDFAGNVLHAQEIYLHDDSHFYCQDLELDLSLYSFMLYGDTFYGRHGFLPRDKVQKTRYLSDRKTYLQARITQLPAALQKMLSYDTNSVIEAMQQYRCSRLDGNDVIGYFPQLSFHILKALKVETSKLGKTFGHNYGLWTLKL